MIFYYIYILLNIHSLVYSAKIFSTFSVSGCSLADGHKNANYSPFQKKITVPVSNMQCPA